MEKKSVRILLVDDDDLVVKSLKLLLSRAGYGVTTANTAAEAVSLASVTEFDLVISDIRMPGDNGVTAIKNIKKGYVAKKHRCAYLLITGYAEEDTPEHALRLGINKFIFKPFDNQKLLDSIEEELSLLRESEKLSHAEELPAPITAKKIERTRGAYKRVVITGVGAVAPNGIGKEEYWAGIMNAKNCVDKISFFDTTDFTSKASAEIRNFNPVDYGVDAGEVKRMGRSSHLAVSAANLALKDSGLLIDDTNRENMGVILGSAVSGLEYVEKDFRSLERRGPKRVRPFLGIAGFAGAISSEISRNLRIKGKSLTISTGCTSSTDAMGAAFDEIREGKTEVIITGGADACITAGILSAFCQMGAVSTWEKDLQRASRPFNRDRDGFVIGEGAWIFVFEELEHAIKRGATIYGELIGYGATCDAWHMAKPHPSGHNTARAINLALMDANIPSEKVDLFESYGNGTPINDSYETGVVKLVFGKHAYDLMMPSLKSMLGHPLGASGAQQVAAAILALNKGIVHPTINYEEPDPECDLDYVANKAREKEVKTVVCSSIAFGAKNAAILVSAFNGK